jgi:hypothetical protein
MLDLFSLLYLDVEYNHPHSSSTSLFLLLIMSLVSSSPPPTKDGPPLILIFNDLEMSGPFLHSNFVVSWGSVAYNACTRECLGEHLVLYKNPYYVKGQEDHTELGWDEECKQWWLKDPESDLAKEYARANRGEGHSVTSGTTDKIQWINQIITAHAEDHPERVLFVSDTCGPDNMWMNSYTDLAEHLPMQKFCGPFRDTFSTSSFALGLLRDLTGVPLSIAEQQYFSENRMVRKYFQVPDFVQPKTQNDHNPINDCKNIAEEFWIHVDYAHARELESIRIAREHEDLIKTHRHLLEEVVHLKAEMEELKKENQEYKKMETDHHPATADCPDQECYLCGARDCPSGNSIHYDKDGCPSCEGGGSEPSMTDEEPEKKEGYIIPHLNIKGPIKTIILLDNHIYKINGKDFDNADGNIFKTYVYPCLHGCSVEFLDNRSEEAKAAVPLYAACWPTSVDNAKTLVSKMIIAAYWPMSIENAEHLQGNMISDYKSMNPVFVSYLETLKIPDFRAGRTD